MDARPTAQRLVENIERVIIGKRAQVEQAVMTLMCGGHLLIEDVPGVGKTMLARSLARSSGCSFNRIQFTPDLLPTDVTGVSVYNQKNGDFEFRPGPVLSQVVLADEINRATPKAQSALLEAMEERQVTVDGVTYRTPEPFMVMATQNPIEYEGTFPLPEAQLDRFLIRLELGYPSAKDEQAMMKAQLHGHPVGELAQVCDPSDILGLQAAVREVYVDVLIQQYIVSVAEATRSHPSVYLGASPRGSLALQRLGQAKAIIDDRDYVLPDDVKALAYPALGHRIILNAQSRVKGTTAAQVVEEVLNEIPVPGVRPDASREARRVDEAAQAPSP
ncbi:MAG TPA: MoxR family ATPase [Dehalococcoidia bacterium]|nr:MoxR family ATPase [Dehalococcoidia bacterium]